jgi:hypothetical protein
MKIQVMTGGAVSTNEEWIAAQCPQDSIKRKKSFSSITSLFYLNVYNILLLFSFYIQYLSNTSNQGICNDIHCLQEF